MARKLRIPAQSDISSIDAVFGQLMPWRHAGLRVWRAALPRFERDVVTEVRSALADPTDRRHVLLVGLRRIGKTVAMQQVAGGLLDAGVDPERIGWLRLDHPQLRPIPLGDLVARLFAGAPEGERYLLLDEVTAGTDWDLWLKAFYDDRWPMRVVATSSATSVLKPARSESGAGRWRELDLPVWLLHEFAGLQMTVPPLAARDLGSALELGPPAMVWRDRVLDVDTLANVALVFGGIPEVFPLEAGAGDPAVAVLRAQDRLRSDIVQNAIYRDLALAVGIDRPDKLEQLLTILAAQVGQLASPTSLAQTLGMAQPTVDRYLQHLEDVHLLFRLYNHAPTAEATARRGRKVFLADTAVRNAILGRVPDSGWDLPRADAGLLRENQVAIHLRAYAAHRSTRLYYWRDGKHEVDFYVADPAAPVAFEVASGPGHSREGLRRFLQKHPELAHRCWILWPDARWNPASAAPDGIGTFPLGSFLLRCGQLATRPGR